MSDSTLITTLIPTFKRPERLKKAIQSVLDQTYPHFQVRVYDNASGDETKEVVSEFIKRDHRVHYHCHESNSGAAENFQYALSHVQTLYFSFLSDDDFLFPEFYETTLKGFERYPDAAFSAGAVLDMNERQKVLRVVLSKWPDQEYYKAPYGFLEMIGKYSNWVGSLFRTEVIQQIGPLDLSLKAIDIDYVFRIAQRFPFVISKKPVAIFMQHPLSYSNKNTFKLIWPGWKIMMNKVEQNVFLPSEFRALAVEKLSINLQNVLFSLILRSVKNREFEQALEALKIYKQVNGKKIVRLLLTFTIYLCKMVPIFHWVFLFIVFFKEGFSRPAVKIPKEVPL